MLGHPFQGWGGGRVLTHSSVQWGENFLASTTHFNHHPSLLPSQLGFSLDKFKTFILVPSGFWKSAWNPYKQSFSVPGCDPGVTPDTEMARKAMISDTMWGQSNVQCQVHIPCSLTMGEQVVELPGPCWVHLHIIQECWLSRDTKPVIVKHEETDQVIYSPKSRKWFILSKRTPPITEPPRYPEARPTKTKERLLMLRFTFFAKSWNVGPSIAILSP